MSSDASTNDLFELINVVANTVTPPKELMAEAAAVGWTDWLTYPSARELTFGIRRRKPMPNDGNNLCVSANAIRRYINARTEVYVLDFIPNHEQSGGAKTVIEVGETCLINEIRTALNGVMAKQVRGNIYELHAVNDTPVQMDIMTRHISLKGENGLVDAGDKFPPTIKLGRLEPASELHISMIYMKPGRVYTNIQPTFENGEIVMPPDNTCYLHNGLVQWRQPDMIDAKTTLQLRDPMLESPGLIEMQFYPQPYIDPADILGRALQQLIDDFKIIEGHAIKAATTTPGIQEVRNPSERRELGFCCEYAFGDVSIKVGPDSDHPGAENLMATTSGFDESLGKTIAWNATHLGGRVVTHFTAHLAHVTRKDVIIRISAPDALGLFTRAIQLAIARVVDLLAQLAALKL